MGMMDFIKGELIDIIEWTDDSRDTLSFRFPDDDKAIKNGAQLIVRESQQVQFVYLGEFGDTFGPGKHTLTTDNIPVLTQAEVVEVRLQLAVQGGRLLRQHAALHRQQVGHGQSDHDARRRPRHRPRPRVRHLRFPDRRHRSCSSRKSPAPITTSGSTSSPTRCARASSACSPTRWRRRRSRCSTSPAATPSSARRCCRSSTRSSPRSTGSRSPASSSRTCRCRRRSSRRSTSGRAWRRSAT